MRQFDEILRQGLMEANLAQYQPALDRVSGWEPEFSPRYRRERIRLLADPWGWVRRRERPMWKRAARAAACVVLACTLLFGALMAASPSVRAEIFGWLRTFAYGEVFYETPSEADLKVYEEPPRWRPTWVPEGFHLSGVSVSGAGRPQSPAGSRYHLNYEEDGISEDTRGFVFICHHSTGAHLGLGSTEGVTAESAQVWGMEADFYADEYGRNRLLWGGPGGELFRLESSLDKETLVKIADSVQETDGPPLPEYRPQWLPELAPEGLTPPHDAIRSEAVQLSFQLKDLSDASLLYASPEMGPLWTPEGATEEEAVEVNGIPARFWPAMEPDDGVMGAAMKGDVETGEMTVVSRGLTIWNMNTLMWTDPETGIAFQLTATTLLPKEDLIRMAESIQAVE